MHGNGEFPEIALLRVSCRFHLGGVLLLCDLAAEVQRVSGFGFRV